MTGHNPTTDRGKLGTKRHILTTDKDGIPLTAIITSANTHDVTTAIDTVDSIVIKRQLSSSTYQRKRNRIYALIKHIIQRSRTRNCQKGIHITYTTQKRERIFRGKHPVRRWVIEKTNSWHNNRFRKLFTKNEKKRKRTIWVL